MLPPFLTSRSIRGKEGVRHAGLSYAMLSYDEMFVTFCILLSLIVETSLKIFVAFELLTGNVSLCEISNFCFPFQPENKEISYYTVQNTTVQCICKYAQYNVTRKIKSSLFTGVNRSYY